jgi:exopolysaccharide biosynthesis polyprenyl glycosylphosphotransferase
MYRPTLNVRQRHSRDEVRLTAAASAHPGAAPAIRGSAAPEPVALAPTGSRGIAHWALEGRGWQILQPTVDFVLATVAVVLALGGPAAVADVDGVRAPLLALPPLIVLFSHLRGVYRTKLHAIALDMAFPLLSAVSVAAMTVAVAGRLFNGADPSQPPWLRAWAFALVAVGVGRLTLYVLQRRARALRLVGQPVVIVGAGLVGAQLARRLETNPEYGLVPVGFLDDDPPLDAEVGGREAPLLGTVDDLDRAIEQTGASNIIVAFSSVTDARISRLVQRSQELGVDVAVVPRMFETINHRVVYDTVGGIPLMSFSIVDPRGVQFAVKHTLDFVLAALLLVLLSPLLLACAVAVRLGSPGPIFFRQARVGRDGKLFDLYKFRSMREADPHEEAACAAFVPDPGTAPGGVEGVDRRTRIGRFMRATSIDELPQLLNVLRGDMSLVGPRPERPEFVEVFRQDIRRYGDRHRVKSGITGWAQVHGLRGQSSIADRVEWDNYYIAHWSLGLDLKILLLTFKSLFEHAD